MANREYLVDVSAYQGTSMAQYHSRGATGIIVKGTEGQWYRNPLAVKQITSAHYHHMWVHMYHFANFGHSVHQAKLEARACLAEAKHLNISKKRYIFCDWEASAQNYIQGSRLANTKAILAFMKVCHDTGYHVGLYSGASALRNNVDASTIVKKYGACLWVASYATMGRIDTPNFGHFPSMDGVAIWQFTDNWCGLNVDGNITLKELITDAVKSPAKKVVAKPKTPSICYVPILYGNPNYKVRLLDSDGHYQKYIATNTHWKVWSVKIIKGMKCYRIGTDKQWVPAKFTKIIK